MSQRRADCGILDVRLNQDNDCFACALQTGIRIYEVDPLGPLEAVRAASVGSVRLVEMLHRSNWLAVLSGGTQPKFEDNIMRIYDAGRSEVVREWEMCDRVINVRLLPDLVVICLRDQILAYFLSKDAQKCHLLRVFKTRPNDLGLCIVSKVSRDRFLLAFPASKGPGCVQLEDLRAADRAAEAASGGGGGGGASGAAEVASASGGGGASGAPVVIDAHQHELACVVFNNAGSMIATASKHGTLIRIHDTTTRKLLSELRRGSDTAAIFCLNFSSDSSFICASSDKGTVHIFAVNAPSLNRRGALGLVSDLVGVETPQWSLTHFTIPPECACQCAFVKERHEVAALCIDGTYHRYNFQKDGKCNRVKFGVFVQRHAESDEI